MGAEEKNQGLLRPVLKKIELMRNLKFDLSWVIHIHMYTLKFFCIFRKRASLSQAALEL
jgi:ATP phosphoribosyltransferase regulatory subunit HisZ